MGNVKIFNKAARANKCHALEVAFGQRRLRGWMSTLSITLRLLITGLSSLGEINEHEGRN